LIHPERKEEGMRLNSLSIPWAVAFMALFSCLFIAYVSLALAEPLNARPDYIYVHKDENKTVSITGGNFRSQCSVTSSDPSVATGKFNQMSKDLEITGVGVGEAKITLTDSDFQSVTIRVKVFSVYMSG
jgi:hypothetical protein